MTEQVDQSFKNYPKDPNGIMGFQPNKDLTTPENMSKENRYGIQLTGVSKQKKLI